MYQKLIYEYLFVKYSIKEKYELIKTTEPFFYELTYNNLLNIKDEIKKLNTIYNNIILDSIENFFNNEDLKMLEQINYIYFTYEKCPILKIILNNNKNKERYFIKEYIIINNNKN
jgi:hypothetical protein